VTTETGQSRHRKKIPAGPLLTYKSLLPQGVPAGHKYPQGINTRRA
jgi:hypothetical protein